MARSATACARSATSKDGNIQIEYRWADGNYDRFPKLIAELLGAEGRGHRHRRHAGGAGGRSAATSDGSAGHGGGAATRSATASCRAWRGPAETSPDIILFRHARRPKRLELLHEILPKADRIGMLVHSSNPGAEFQLKIAQTAASAPGNGKSLRGSRKQQTATFKKHSTRLWNGAWAQFWSGRRSVYGTASAYIDVRHSRHTLPSDSASAREFVEAGGLMTLRAKHSDAYRQRGASTWAKFSRAPNPPICRSQCRPNSCCSINLKTAKVLGISIPPIGAGPRRRSHRMRYAA